MGETYKGRKCASIPARRHQAMRPLEAGFACQNFSPAAAAGGTAALGAIGAPLPQIRFCPTGGISAGDGRAYLRLQNVTCVGGSWLAPANAVEAGDWGRIRRVARAAVALRP
jgi:2-dehydro-3-deoxyphosphogluconate aldolase / (4S)-4-hydroxy-2-oxoglutarate aldolase